MASPAFAGIPVINELGQFFVKGGDGGLPLFQQILNDGLLAVPQDLLFGEEFLDVIGPFLFPMAFILSGNRR
jgi:hypothetical protein